MKLISLIKKELKGLKYSIFKEKDTYIFQYNEKKKIIFKYSYTDHNLILICKISINNNATIIHIDNLIDYLLRCNYEYNSYYHFDYYFFYLCKSQPLHRYNIASFFNQKEYCICKKYGFTIDNIINTNIYTTYFRVNSFPDNISNNPYVYSFGLYDGRPYINLILNVNLLKEFTYRDEIYKYIFNTNINHEHIPW